MATRPPQAGLQAGGWGMGVARTKAAFVPRRPTDTPASALCLHTRLRAHRPQEKLGRGGTASPTSVLRWAPGLLTCPALAQSSWPRAWQVGLGPGLSLARPSAGSGVEGAPGHLPVAPAARGGEPREAGSRISAPREGTVLWPRVWCLATLPSG